MLNGSEARMMSISKESALDIFEEKVLHIGNGEHCWQWNDKLYEIHRDIDIVQRLKKQWLGHVVQTDETTHAFKVCSARWYKQSKRKSPSSLEGSGEDQPSFFSYPKHVVCDLMLSQEIEGPTVYSRNTLGGLEITL